MNSQRFWSVFGVGCGLFVLSLDWSIVNNALPAIQKSLHASLSELQWIMNIFALVIAVLLVTMGRLADAFGRKKLFTIGLLIGALAALGSALSPTPISLIAFRALQGASAATIVTSSQSLLTHAFPENQHGKAMGIWITIIGAGLSFGPVLGGFIIQLLSWHWIFFMNIPLLAISLFLVIPLISESRNEKQPAHIDFPGISLLILTLGCFVLATIQGPNWGWSSPLTLCIYALAIISGISFVLVEYHVKTPLLEFHLFKNWKFISGALTKFGLVFMVWGVFFLLPLYFQNVQKFSPIISGLLLLTVTLSFTVTSHLVGRIADRINKKYLIWIGMFVVILTLLTQVLITSQTSPFFFICFFFFLGVGWGMSSGPGTSMGISALPRHVTGVASGTLVTIQEIGGAVGLAVIGTVFRVYENAMFQKQISLTQLDLAPNTLEKVRELLSSSDSFTNLVTHFPIPTQEKITRIFNEAFIHGLHRGLWVATGVMALTLLLIFLMLRRES